MNDPENGRKPGMRVALLMWGDVVEDFLEPIGWTLDRFLAEMTGGWLFGYTQALATQQVESVLVLMTRDRGKPSEAIHAPSGMRVRLIPATWRYRLLRRYAGPPYVWRPIGTPSPPWQHHTIARRVELARSIAAYLATPKGPLARVLREERCDAILCQEYEDPRFDIAVDVGRGLGLPVVSTFQGARAWRSDFEHLRRPRAIASAAAFIIASSREARRVRERYAVPPERVHEIPNPIDTAMWYPEQDPGMRASLGLAERERVVAWHGRVDIGHKGLDILLDAWRLMREAHPSLAARLLLIGTGRNADELRQMLAERNDASVTWIDRYVAERDWMRRVLSAADVSVLSSRFEGMPVAPMEAMACGLPVVATDAEGIEDIFPDGEADGGHVVPRENPAALASALARVLCDDDGRRSLGRRALARVRSYGSFDAVGGRLAALLRDAASRQPSR